MRDITIITAMTTNQCIGMGNELPWRQREDLRHFKAITENSAVIMGRKTLDSLNGKPLPNRLNIVLSRSTVSESGDNVIYTNSIDNALEIADSMGLKPFIIGGAEIYNLAMPLVTKMYITMLDTTVDGDAFFPDFDYREWEQTIVSSGSSDTHNDHDYTIHLLEKK
jgi:dihydrofolate reductase